MFDDVTALMSSMHGKENIEIRNERRISRSKNTFVGLKTSAKITKVMKINARRQDSIKVFGSQIRVTEEYTCLGSTLTKDGGTEARIGKRLSKARNSFIILGNVWKSESYS